MLGTVLAAVGQVISVDTSETSRVGSAGSAIGDLTSTSQTSNLGV